MPEPLNETDRCIKIYPQPYLMNVTVNKQYDFNPHIVAECLKKPNVKMVKAVVVGDSTVGKSSLLQRFCYNTFRSDYKSTIGVDFEVEKFQILNTPFKVQFWDTAGQERFKCMAASYYRGSKAVIVVFDMSNTQSLMNAKQWAKEARLNATTVIDENKFIINDSKSNSYKNGSKVNQNHSNASCNTNAQSSTNSKYNRVVSENEEDTNSPLMFLVGTKKDLVSDKVWKEVELLAANLAKDIGAELWVVSSKTGERVNDFFFRLAALMFERAIEREMEFNENNLNHVQYASELIKVDQQYAAKSTSNCCR